MREQNFPPDQDLIFPDWQPNFIAALVETDPQQPQQRVLNFSTTTSDCRRAQRRARATSDGRRYAGAALDPSGKTNYPDWRTRKTSSGPDRFDVGSE